MPTKHSPNIHQSDEGTVRYVRNAHQTFPLRLRMTRNRRTEAESRRHALLYSALLLPNSKFHYATHILSEAAERRVLGMIQRGAASFLIDVWCLLARWRALSQWHFALDLLTKVGKSRQNGASKVSREQEGLSLRSNN